VTVRLRFLRQVDEGGSWPEFNVTLEPRQSLAIEDVLSSAFGLERGFGALQVLAGAGSLVVESRTATTGPRGSVGVGIPAVPAAACFTEATFPGPVLAGLREDDGFRSNLVLVNCGLSPVSLLVQASDGGEARYELPPLGMLQDARFLARPELGGAPRTGVSVTLSAASPAASFTALATVIDNVTNDPTTVLPQ